MEHQLVISGPGLQDKVFSLPLGGAVLGREEGVTIHLPDPLVSRVHARLDCSESGCQITDLGSTNATRLGNRKLEANNPVSLTDGAVIKIGPYELTYHQIRSYPQPESRPKPDVEEKGSPTPVLPPSIIPPGSPPTAGRTSADDPLRPPPGLGKKSIKLIDYLPPIYQTEFMKQFLAIFEAVLMPIEWNVDNFDLYLDPATAPADFLRWLAGWYDIVFDDSWSDEQQRTLLAEAHQLYARRGTKFTLSRVLEIYTGQKPEISDTGEAQPPDTFTVRLPGEGGEKERIQIEAIIEANKPAHTQYKLVFSAK